MKNLMTKFNKILVLILVIQASLVAAFYFTQQSANTHRTAIKPFVDISNVDKIQLEDKQSMITLVSENDSWFILADEQQPADNTKVTNLLNQLKQIKANWPVASTA